ncbi:hypothetical protein PHYBOEH_008030 [Phytophthora boehmeriae]|uniref:Uncharacterized protein n=1 Tax=Phytophthora boehmeriae TaxID=109152 RepID=A0A8T1W3T1_9STRA|nr:hypothetical protein PHYBOEH_008030 [Phytophthora boehmeriae]
MNSPYHQLPTFTNTTQDLSAEFYRNTAEFDAAIRGSFLSEARRCRYPSKRCEHPRAIKRNGEMHRFCDAHRNKANLNQRRLEARRKQEQMAESPLPRLNSPLNYDLEPRAFVKLENQHPWPDAREPTPPLHTVLAQDELKFLWELLS